MTKIKIISNPYNQEMRYFNWNENIDDWVEVDYANNKNSKLLSEKLKNGFFPFRVKEIVDAIIDEYMDDTGRMSIEFEGADDEFLELASACAEGKYQEKISIKKSNKRLANAREILPEIIKVFKQDLTPLILKTIDSDAVSDELNKFSDVSKDIIPICILGNYSAGKSSFINALIGNEILPSGDEPVTAKIYQIKRSTAPDRALIEFELDGVDMKIQFTKLDINIIYAGDNEEFVTHLVEQLETVNEKSITERVNKTLSVINSFNVNGQEDRLSNLISIRVPFTGELSGKGGREYVIFDTPGSNSASNDKHLQVLKEQMSKLSNGLPIFVSEYNSLDSVDNETLYKTIKEVNELDERFTMIVVNKADASRIPKTGFSDEEVDNILNMTVPKNLYTEGIFFVSSILGLGSKTDGEFIDDHYAEIYESEHNKFADPNSRFYKSLYKINIMPKQIKSRVIDSSMACDNYVYANSGLYAVEEEIGVFASRYSYYNKCKQAQLFLDKVIGRTSRELQNKQDEQEKYKEEIESSFNSNKTQLIESLKARKAWLIDNSIKEYEEYMEPVIKEYEVVFSEEQLNELEQEYIAIQREENLYDSKQQDVSKARENMKNHFIYNFGKVFKNINVGNVVMLGTSFAGDYSEVSRSNSVLKETEKTVISSATDDLLEQVKSSFIEHLTCTQNELQIKSYDFWKEKTDIMRNELAAIVTGSEDLSEETKEELKKIILSYKELDNENIVAEDFIKDDFEKGLWVGKIKIISSDRLNIKKIVEKYRLKTLEQIDMVSNKINKSHISSMQIWIDKLYIKILNNMEEFNQELKDKRLEIEKTSEIISELKQRQIDIDTYNQYIKSMMDWSEV